jgi:hypothetical protein
MELAWTLHKAAGKDDLLENYRKRMDAFSKAGKALAGYDRSKNPFMSTARAQFDIAAKVLAESFSNESLAKRIPGEWFLSEIDGYPPAIAILDRNETPMLKTTGLVAKIYFLAGAAVAAAPPAISFITRSLDGADPAWMVQGWTNPHGIASYPFMIMGGAFLLVAAAVQAAHRLLDSRLRRRADYLQDLISWRKSELAVQNAETVRTRIDGKPVPRNA